MGEQDYLLNKCRLEVMKCLGQQNSPCLSDEMVIEVMSDFVTEHFIPKTPKERSEYINTLNNDIDKFPSSPQTQQIYQTLIDAITSLPAANF